jgi:DNA replication protein DnaC
MSDTTAAVVKKAGDVLKSGIIEYPEIDIKCPIHGTFRGKPYSFSWTPEHKGNINYPECPKCVEESEAKKAIETAERERELAKQRHERRMKSMNIGKRYWDTKFEVFDDYADELKRHLITAVNFARNPEGKLVMLGENGSGKTHLAVSILKITGGVIYTAYEIGMLLKKSYDGVNKEWEILEELCETKLLVIDEIGRTKGQDWELNWLSHIINKRHENLKPLILISNRHLSYDCPEGPEGCSHCLEKYFDNDVISRIIEDGLIMKFTVDDYRKRKGQEYRELKKIEAAQGEK